MMDMTPQPPPIQSPRGSHTPAFFSPMTLSALVYPGAGQLMQRRWLAGTIIASLFTVPAVWFFIEVFGVLKAYYEFAFDFSGATGLAPSLGSMVVPFLASTAVYLAGLVDTAVASYRQRVGSRM